MLMYNIEGGKKLRETKMRRIILQKPISNYWVVLLFSVPYLFSPVSAHGFSKGREVTSASSLQVLFTGSREGEIEPCGCQVHQIGGLHRLQTLMTSDGLKNGPNEARLYVDAGDSFFSLPQLPESRIEREKRRAGLIASSFRRFQLRALNVGPRDLASGMDVLKSLEKSSGATFISSNLRTKKDKSPFPGFVKIEVGGAKINIIGVMDPQLLPPDSDYKALDPLKSIAETLKKIKPSKDEPVILLSLLDESENQKIAEQFAITLIIRGHAFEVTDTPITKSGTTIVQVKNQGQQLGKVRYKFTGGKIEGFEAIDLDEALDRENELHQQMKEYKEEVRQQAIKESANFSEKESDNPYVANAFYCKTCHQKQYDFWKDTKHASAYLVLYAKNQHFDPDCIKCHSIGYQDPKGFSNIAKPIELTADAKVSEKGPIIETLMKKVFSEDTGKGALDSRKEPARYAKLKKKYHEVIDTWDENEWISQLHAGVQCEHCHGNRHGHPGSGAQTQKKVVEVSCKNCHSLPHASPYDPKRFPEVACPLSSSM